MLVPGSKYRTPTIPRSLGRAGPFRTGGFYGASQRSPLERKSIDAANAVVNLSTAGSVTLINGVATGTDFTARIGRRINVVTIQLRAYFDIADTSSADVDATRVMIVEDLQSNGVIATIAQILADTAGNTHPMNHLNLDNRQRFRVHYDKQFSLGLYSAAADGFYNKQPTINFYKKCNIPVEFSGTTAGIGSIASGAIYLVTLGSAAAATWKMSFVPRCRFIDP